MLKAILCVLVILIGTQADAEIRQSGSSIYLSAKDVSWEMKFPKGDWQLKLQRHRQDGRGHYYMFTASDGMTNVSFYIEPAERCSSASDCRQLYWSSPNPLMANPQEVKFLERNGFAVVRFLIPTFKGERVDQLNYSAHAVRDGYWVDVHISKMMSKSSESALFSDFLDRVSFELKRSASRI